MKRFKDVSRRLGFINSLKEGFGFRLYFDGEYYFYAWNADRALNKINGNILFLINDYGQMINVIANMKENSFGIQDGY